MNTLTEQQKQKIKEIVSKVTLVDIDEIQDSSNMCHELGMDSLDQLEMRIDLEDSFDIYITDEEAERMHVISDVYKTVEKLLTQQK
jgi:acyl carrier protein